MRKYIFTAIMVSVTLTSCLSFFPDRYEKSLVYNGFQANTNTMIGTKVNIKGYYSLVTDSNISASEGKYLVTYNGRISTLAGYNPFILYEDGTYGNILFNAVGKDFSANEYYKKVDMELDKECKPLNNIYLMRSGYYKLKEDTICVTTYIFYMLRTELVLLRYKIIDRNHLLLLDETYISGNENENDTCVRNRIFEFIPAKTLPSSSLFPIKKKRWAWASKKDWKQFKHSIARTSKNKQENIQ
ncbi:hypothetical protein [Segatella bryantii]|jgi:hypothetical protein|uniref:hypothetical protein n=1 Tax=Segatella bryantii TaxID=77095 RepID=UPI00242C3C00|nr:hypothetical protein [Segatella bryantii]